MTQPCGHDESHRKTADYGTGTTYCDECLPDGSLETYVRANVAAFVTANGCYAAASVPPSLGGKIAATPFETAEEAIAFADGLRHEAWVIDPAGKSIHHHPGARE